MIGRVADSVTYLLGTLRRLARLPRPDAVVALSDPPLLLAAALLVGRVRGYRTIFWLQDLYPHLAGKLGVLREGGLAYRGLHRIASHLHAAVDGVITLGPAMSRTMVASGSSAERTAHVHNWADTRAVYPVLPGENPFVTAHGLAGKFVVLYSGNAGRAHEFGAVMEAMRRLRDDPGVVFVFIGGGHRLSAIRSEAERHGLVNRSSTRFPPPAFPW
jgi:colanic acid biosynthesis glycosyl transferase WcaI